MLTRENAVTCSLTGLVMVFLLIPCDFIMSCLKASRTSSGTSYAAQSSLVCGTASTGPLRFGFSFGGGYNKMQTKHIIMLQMQSKHIFNSDFPISLSSHIS